MHKAGVILYYYGIIYNPGQRVKVCRKTLRSHFPEGNVTDQSSFRFYYHHEPVIVLISACLIKAWYVPKIVHAKQTTKEEMGWKKQIRVGGHGAGLMNCITGPNKLLNRMLIREKTQPQTKQKRECGQTGRGG